MRGHNLPVVSKLLEVHGGVAHQLYLGSWERRRPPGEGEGKIRLEEFDLDARGFYEPHRTTVRIHIDIGFFARRRAYGFFGCIRLSGSMIHALPSESS
jgi:hypothetical protein